MVELGFALKKDPRWLVNRYFPSKIGGKPAWLHLDLLPTAERLICEKCKKRKTFLLQLYVPFDDEHNFHRMIYVFVCRTEKCFKSNDASVVTVFRSQLPRKNDFFPETPPSEGAEPLPEIPIGKYIGDGEEVVFPEWEIINDETSDSENEEENSSADEEEEMKKFEKLTASGKTGTLQNLPQSEMEKYTTMSELREDKYFQAFQKECKIHPDQVLRYDRNGKPLWITDVKKSIYAELSSVPRCKNCGSERQFEFQIMPQLLHYIKDYNIDWGVLAIYTCSQSCKLPDTQGYADEFVLKQDVISDAEEETS